MISKFLLRIFQITFILLIHIPASSAQSASQKESLDDLESIQKDFRTWWNYTSRNIHFSENFLPLDTSDIVIEKKQFLEFLTTGKFIPFKVSSNSGISKYKLISLKPLIERDIINTIIQVSNDALEKYKMEGTRFPEFKFTDLNGNVYTTENAKGKIILLKCWFINCQPCVAEMPILNNLIKKYRTRKDILFLSLAFDSKEQLKSFLLQTKFNYAVIPTDQNYIEKTLKVTGYPTHFIITKEGLISKVINNAQEMINAFEIEASK